MRSFLGAFGRDCGHCVRALPEDRLKALRGGGPFGTFLVVMRIRRQHWASITSAPLVFFLQSAAFAQSGVDAAATEAPKEPAAAPSVEPAAGEVAPTAASEPAEENGTKVLVVPYQAIYRSVPQERLDEATRLLQGELDRRDGVIVVRGAQAANAQAPSLEAARKALEEGARAEAEKRIEDAIKHREEAIAAFEANASAIDDAEEYVRALLVLARTYALAGDDDRAKERVDQAMRVAPSFVPPAEEYSRLFRKWVDTAVKKLPTEIPGEVMVSSSLPGATVSLDGRDLEVAPVLLQKVVPGRHVLRASIEGVPPFGTVVTVASKTKVDVMATFSGTAGGDSVGRVTDAISTNALPPDAVKAAAAAGKDAGAAFVVFGAMAKTENRYTLHTYVVSVEQQKLSTLDVASFDLDMLTAESDVLKIVQAAHGRIDNFTKPETAVAKIETRLRPENTIKSVAVGLPTQGAGPATAKTPAKPGGSRGPIRSLSTGSIEIKDEEGSD